MGRLLIEGVAVPRSRLAEAVRAVAAFAHAADGNLHPIFVLDAAAPANPVPEPV